LGEKIALYLLIFGVFFLLQNLFELFKKKFQ
jgi:hypothetical protein